MLSEYSKIFRKIITLTNNIEKGEKKISYQIDIETKSGTELGDILHQDNSMTMSLLPHLPHLLPNLVGDVVFQDCVKFR